MPPAAGGDFLFGSFRIDLATTQLVRDEVFVAMPVQYVRLLIKLVSHAGNVVSKDDLISAGWGEQSIGDGSLTQAVFKIRRVLDPDHLERYIVKEKGRGYRFVAPVTRRDARARDADIDAIDAARQASSSRRAALEALERDRINATEPDYERLLGGKAGDCAACVGLAYVNLARHEGTRRLAVRDAGALSRADDLTREALRLNVRDASAWLARGVVLERLGQRAKAINAFHEAIALDPLEWRNCVIWGWGTWDRERMAAATRLLVLQPNSPIARWFIASVLVARGALREAEAEIDLGLAALARSSMPADAFPAIALYWLKGLLLLARGCEDEALAAFAQELALDAGAHIYASETRANTFYAIGAVHVLRAMAKEARAAFEQAIALVHGHPLATAGLALLAARRGRKPTVPVELTSVDAAIAHVLPLVVPPRDAAKADTDLREAARLVKAALLNEPPGHAGWTIPIDPLLRVYLAPEAWAEVLQLLHDRSL